MANLKKNQYNRDDRKLITTPTSFHHIHPIHPTTATTKATKSSNNSDSNINNGDTDSLKKIIKIKVDFSIALSTSQYFYLEICKNYINHNLYKLSIQNFSIASSYKLTNVFAQQSIIYELIGPLTGFPHVKFVDLSGNVFKFIQPPPPIFLASS